MTQVTFHSAHPEHGPYLLVLGWQAPATGLQPPIVIPHVLPDLPVLLSLLLAARRGRAVTEDREKHSITQLMGKERSWGWRKCGQQGAGKHSKPNRAVKIDVGNLTETLCWEADTGSSDLSPEQCCKPNHCHHLLWCFKSPSETE